MSARKHEVVHEPDLSSIPSARSSREPIDRNASSRHAPPSDSVPDVSFETRSGSRIKSEEDPEAKFQGDDQAIGAAAPTVAPLYIFFTTINHRACHVATRTGRVFVVGHTSGEQSIGQCQFEIDGSIEKRTDVTSKLPNASDTTFWNPNAFSPIASGQSVARGRITDGVLAIRKRMRMEDSVPIDEKSVQSVQILEERS